MLKIKPFSQSTGLCGPATLKMVLEYFGVKKTEKELAALTKANPAHGVEAAVLLRATQRLGFTGFIKDFSEFSDVKKYLDQGIPVIVDWFSGDDGHYSVVVGLTDKYIYLQDPEIGRSRRIALPHFKRIWFDFRGNFISSPKDMVVRRILVIHPPDKKNFTFKSPVLK